MRMNTDPGLLGEEFHVHNPGNGTEADGEGGHVHQQAANKYITNSSYRGQENSYLFKM